MSLAQALRSPQFVILLLTNFFCCATHSGPIIHTVSYATTCGIPMIAAVTIYNVEGLAGSGARIPFGLLGDRLGAKRVLVAGLFAQAFGALAYVFVSETRCVLRGWRRCLASSAPSPCRSIRYSRVRTSRCG
jgi:MFS family permease